MDRPCRPSCFVRSLFMLADIVLLRLGGLFRDGDAAVGVDAVDIGRDRCVLLQPDLVNVTLGAQNRRGRPDDRIDGLVAAFGLVLVHEGRNGIEALADIDPVPVPAFWQFRRRARLAPFHRPQQGIEHPGRRPGGADVTQRT
jgi:hypothetical protein